jgi:hypothetical protein
MLPVRGRPYLISIYLLPKHSRKCNIPRGSHAVNSAALRTVGASSLFEDVSGREL